MCPQDRRRRCIAIIALVVVVVLLVAVPLGVIYGKTFKERFIEECERPKGNYDCEEIFRTFEQAYVGRDPCKVPADAYSPLFKLVPFALPCDKTMFWSKTQPIVEGFTSRNKGHFVTIEKTMLGSVLDGLKKLYKQYCLGELNWCGKEGSQETFTKGCPEWEHCKENPRRSFWAKASAKFAEASCGDTTAMLSGSEDTPFNTSSHFAENEVPELRSPKVKKLTVILVMPTNPKSSCFHSSFVDLRGRLGRQGISFECKEVAQSTIEQCSSPADGPYTPCW